MNRIIEVDILRAIAIFAIIASHFRFVIPQLNSPLMLEVQAGIAACGLSLFFMLSGYSLMIRERKFETPSDYFNFYKKRIVRLFPLYWIALVVAYIIEPVWYPGYANFTILQHILTISGLQILFTQIIENPVLWFVSAILILYILFPFIISLAKSLRLPSGYSMIVSGLVPFIIFILLSFITSIDPRFFAYYWFFIAGVILCKEADLTHIDRYMAYLSGIAIFGLGVLYLVHERPFLILGHMSLSIQYPLDYILFQSLVGIVGISMAIAFMNSVKRIFNGRLLAIVKRIAISTYSIYLFHLYFLSIASTFGAMVDLNSVPFFVLLIGVPMAIAIPPYIETIVNKFVFSLINTIHSKAKMHDVRANP